MKKLLTLTALLGAASLSFGQGNVNFVNGVAATTHVSTNSVLGGPATGQTAPTIGLYYYTLFVADSTITSAGTPTIYGALDPTLLNPTFDTHSWLQVTNGSVTAYGTNTAALGRMNGNPDSNATIVSGRANGSSASFIMVGWSANVAGADWASAKAYIDGVITQGSGSITAWYGASAVATSVQLGGGITPAGTVFGAAAGQVAGPLLQLQPVPEPSTFALAGLGAAALLIFRRRKQ